MLKPLKDRWAGFTRRDRIALLLAEVAVIASCIALLVPFFQTSDWQTLAIVGGVTFVGLEVIVLVVAHDIAASRRRKVAPAESRKEETTTLGRAVLFGFCVFIAYGAGGSVAEWLFPQSELATKWRYGLASDLTDAVYVIDKRPHDCEFMTAPLGDKHCHYDKQVATIRVRSGPSGREVSYNDGKSWGPADPSGRSAVVVTWSRVQD